MKVELPKTGPIRNVRAGDDYAIVWRILLAAVNDLRRRMELREARDTCNACETTRRHKEIEDAYQKESK